MESIAEKSHEDGLGRQGVVLPSQPAVLQELMQLPDPEYLEVKAVADLIARDAGLVAGLFRIARSPVYSRGRVPETVLQVLQVVGLGRSLNLLKAIALRQAVRGDPAMLERFWTRSHDIAMRAALIAEERVHVCNVFPDQAYLAGMFHDCGVPVLATRFPKYWARLDLADEGAWGDVRRENQYFNLDHCVVGYLIARHWGLPTFICEAIRIHHEMPEESSNVRAVIGILHLATMFYLRRRGIACREWERYRERWLPEFGLHSSELVEFMDEIEHRMQTATP
ncbi:MAG: HDOD domain-containing protein [Rhodocyclaceae bacterium]|nr:HDOD domain-containing protein [Rhodocyclaceae bacterium]MBX3668581.1 HDOD domain-containing protein [Rhodocyclaceae bacterium]